jgi:hypothetical protein
MQFEISQLPQKQLELIGLSKKDVLSLPPRTLNALLSGHRTSLIRFDKVNIPGINSPLSLDAKLSLERKSDNSVSLKIHPINQSAKNSFNLTKDELGYLANGETNFVSKQLKDNKGKLDDYLVTLDKTTNEFVAVKRDRILAPDVINGTALTEQQKTDFKNGKDISVGDGSYKLDPNSELGVKENSNKPIKNLKLKHSAYSENELLIDLALLTSGLGHFVLLEHLANLALHSGAAMMQTWREENLRNKPTRDALAKTSNELTDSFKQTQKISPEEIKSLIEHHLGRPIELGKVDAVDINTATSSGIEISAEEKTEAKVIDAETPQLSANDSAGEREEKQDMIDERKEEPQKTIQVKL